MPFLAGQGKWSGGIDKPKHCGKRMSMTLCYPFYQLTPPLSLYFYEKIGVFSISLAPENHMKPSF